MASRFSMPSSNSYTYLAMDFGSHSIKCAVCSFNTAIQKVKVLDMFTIALWSGLYDSGHIGDEIALKNVVNRALTDKKVRIKDTVVSIESSEVIEREIVVPKVENEDMHELITYEMVQYLPIDISTYIFEFKIIEEFMEDGNQKCRVMVGAIPREITDQFYGFIHSCDLNPVALDIHTNSIEKIYEIGYKNKNIGKTVAMVDFGHKTINISIIEDGQFQFNRIIYLGGEGIDKILMAFYSLTEKEAELRKMDSIEKKLSPYSDQYKLVELDADENDKKAILDVITFMDECVEEIDHVLKFYNSRSADKNIHSLILYGGMARFSDLRTFIENKLDIKTEIADLSTTIDVSNKVSENEHLYLYLNAIGAIIRK